MAAKEWLPRSPWPRRAWTRHPWRWGGRRGEILSRCQTGSRGTWTCASPSWCPRSLVGILLSLVAIFKCKRIRVKLQLRLVYLKLPCKLRTWKWPVKAISHMGALLSSRIATFNFALTSFDREKPSVMRKCVYIYNYVLCNHSNCNNFTAIQYVVTTENVWVQQAEMERDVIFVFGTSTWSDLILRW